MMNKKFSIVFQFKTYVVTLSLDMFLTKRMCIVYKSF